eukprot:7646738-Pyramimonas_sp.AAC.1
MEGAARMKGVNSQAWLRYGKLQHTRKAEDFDSRIQLHTYPLHLHSPNVASSELEHSCRPRTIPPYSGGQR